MDASDKDWNACFKWLKSQKVLGPGFTAYSAQDLAKSLRDGVVLCHLINVLKPQSLDIREFTQRPQMSQFLCMKNIKIFLRALKKHFAIRDGDLFEPNELFELSDFSKVLKTLSKLSRSEVALESGVTGFNTTQDDDEGIYKNLAELEGDLPDDDIYGPIPAANEEQEEDIYEDLLSVRRRRESRRISTQGSTEFPDTQSGVRDSTIQKTKLDYCVAEIIGTEENYVEVLQMINENFMKQLRSVINDASTMKVIFINIDELYTVHKQLKSELDQAFSENIHKIPEVFTKFKNKLVGYGDYCAGLLSAQNKIDELMNNSYIIKHSINDCQQQVKNGKFKLRDLLVVPMQRILKYPLLLQEMRKNVEKTLDKDSQEAHNMNTAVEAMKDLSYFVNEVKRDRENLEKIAMVEESIEDLSMPPNTKLEDYGHLLIDGKLEIRSHDMNKESKRYIFLFDKVMLMCKTKGDTYSYKSAYILHNYKLQEGTAGIRRRHVFVLADKLEQTAITFYCPSEDSKRKWMDSISIAMDNFSPEGAKSGGFDFIMQSFTKATECAYCKKLLTGCFYQGYLCSKTQKSAHKQCISKIIKGEPSRPLRRPTVPGGGHPRLTHKALYAYNGAPPPPRGMSPLFFPQSAIIDVINEQTNNPDWWMGSYNNTRGYFPAVYLISTNASQIRHSNVRSSSVSSLPINSHKAEPVNRPISRSTSHLDRFTWYVGKHDKAEASRLLENQTDGVYFIRESLQRPGEYALGVAFEGHAKHIKVFQKQEDNIYYLSDTRSFTTIPDMIDYYSIHSLEESFQELRTRLKIPYKEATTGPGYVNIGEQRNSQFTQQNSNTRARPPSYHHSLSRESSTNTSIGPSTRRTTPEIISYAIVTYDYCSTEANQINLRSNDRVAIVSKAGGDRGWWKGGVLDPHTNLLGRVGYFPLTYCEEME